MLGALLQIEENVTYRGGSPRFVTSTRLSTTRHVDDLRFRVKIKECTPFFIYVKTLSLKCILFDLSTSNFLFFQMLSCKDKITAQVKPVSFTINDQTYTGKESSIIRNEMFSTLKKNA